MGCKEEIKEFERMIKLAKLKALSKVSLRRELTEKEFKEMMSLKEILGL